jgi:hypothetical protein
MERFSTIKRQANRTPQMISVQNWLENFICGTRADQKVVGNRFDNLNQPVTQLMFDNRNRWAHVCPYVSDSMDYDHCWIEKSELDGSDPAAIESLLLKQLEDFKSTPPVHDPVPGREPALLPVLWKTFVTFFPRIVREPRTGPFPLIDNLYSRLLPEFVRHGLMFGEFYPRCPTVGIYNDRWPKSFVCPYPAFVIRYMARHDYLFITPNSVIWDAYTTYFPMES